MAPKIALSAGHHNTSGGNATEIKLVGPITRALGQACAARGFDVRIITPDEGLGQFPGSLDKVAKKVVDWASQGWKADIFLEVHGEANSSGNAGRGCFVIYPDWGSDMDVAVKNRLGPAITKSIYETVGIPQRNGGLMSEKQTGVGLDGYRLGIFRVTDQVRTFCTRLIVEVGSYTAGADLAIMNQPSFPERIAAAMAGALADFVGLQPVQPANNYPALGVQPSITLAQWQAALQRHAAPLSTTEASRVFQFCTWLEVDPAFLLAVWKHEGGSPLGSSELQQKSHMPINIKAASDEWRATVAYNGYKWLWAETFQIGLFMSVIHLKNVHGALGRTTVRQIIPVHAPLADNNNPDAYVASVLEDMAYMRSH